jgi:hypothetical protein
VCCVREFDDKTLHQLRTKLRLVTNDVSRDKVGAVARGGVQRGCAGAGAQQQVNKRRGGEDVVQRLCSGCAEVCRCADAGAEVVQRWCKGEY